jgi:cytidyltransferase-like protein
MKNVLVTGGFDNIRSRDLRFLQEASKLGSLSVLLWPDETLVSLTGKASLLPLAERRYFLEAVRYVTRVLVAPAPVLPDGLPDLGATRVDLWVDSTDPGNGARAAHANAKDIEYRVLTPEQMSGFPEPDPVPGDPGRKRIVVTGCYDWFHSGHIRFFEEVSSYGDLYVVIGHDANIELLKGKGHPLFRQEERRYAVGSIRYVKQALISSGQGWLDADPEIRRLNPHVYAVNEDGDKGGKRGYCEKLGIEYLVLSRTPSPGLPGRSSTELRGF